MDNQDRTIQRHWQHWTIKTEQCKDTDNIGQSRPDNTETLATLGTQDEDKKKPHRKRQR